MNDFVKAQRCLRRLVISYNVFFWVTGPGVVGLGIWLYISLSEYEPLVKTSAYIIIFSGVVSIIAGIVGCLGGVNEHKRFLNAYFVLMFTVCVLDVTSCVYIFTEYDKLESTIRPSLESSIHAAYLHNDDSVDDVQLKFSCCGIDGPDDWLGASRNRSVTPLVATTSSLPSSCCGLTSPGLCSPEHMGLFVEGCLVSLMSWSRLIFLIAGWSIFAMACTQLLALAVICCFTKAVTFKFY